MYKSFLSWLDKVFGNTPNIPPEVPPTTATPWITLAKGELGVHEIRGGETARIVEYHSHSHGKFDEDEVPWCASFCNAILDWTGYSRPRGPNDALAASYDNYGEKLSGPKIGCILTFRWSSGGRHVAFCSDFTDDQVKALGGNQSDPNSGGHVSEAWQNKKFVVSYRWPVK